MKITYQPLEASTPVTFVVSGFPVDELIAQEIEKQYLLFPEGTDRRFLVHNSFAEVIFSGAIDQNNQLQSFISHDRGVKHQPIPPKEA